MMSEAVSGSPTGAISRGPSASDFDEQEIRRLTRWAEQSREVALEVTLHGEIVHVSPSVHSLLGYTPGELTGTNVFDLAHPSDVAAAREQLARLEGWLHCRCRHRDGSWRWLEASGREAGTTNGTPHVWLIARDVTGPKWAEEERLALEAQLRQVQKLESLATLTSGVMHDFNNVLAAMVAGVEIARFKTEGQPDVQRHLEQALAAGGKARHLVRQILRFSRDEKPAHQSIRLANVIGEAFKLLRSSLPPAVTLRADIRDSSSFILADATQVHQILMNLCLNAAHAIGGRAGKIVARVDSLFIDDAYPRTKPALPRGAYVRLSVCDNGDGMDAPTLAHIFDPFFTTKPGTEGTGLGLAIVRRIMEEHHGAICVSSTPGEGTTFELFFPRHRPPIVSPGGTGTK